MTETTSKAVRIAIREGGLAAAILARALMRYPQLDVQVYESATTFKERGAAVGLSFNALRALKIIDSKLLRTVDDAGGVESNVTKILIGKGPDKEELIQDVAAFKHDKNRQKTMIVHRAQLLHELLKTDVPSSCLHVNKRLTGIDEDPGSSHSGSARLRLHFEDGSSDYADAIIGADGIHSHVRGHILGKDHPATLPVYAGWWDYRSLVPIAQGVEKIGSKYVDPDDGHQHLWLGHGGFPMHDILDDGKTLQCVAAVRAGTAWDPQQWKKALDESDLEGQFESWLIGLGMTDLLATQEKLTAFSQWQHRDAPTFTKGKTCVIGDAAHAMTPWQGAGAGQAIEDAFILQSLLGKIKETHDIAAAFKAYDAVRRPRSQQVAASSRGTGMIFTGQDEAIGMDPDKLRKALESRWKFIHEVDLEKMERDATDAFENWRQIT